MRAATREKTMRERMMRERIGNIMARGAGGPSFHVPFFFPALMLRVPSPCVLRKGGYDAADRVGSNGSFESIEPKRFTVGSPVSALRNVREGRGTHN
jgi:hypothetical protein